MRLVEETIEVELDGTRYRPTLLHTRSGTLKVYRRLDFWTIRTRWWSREVDRVCLLLETSGGLIEVYTEAGRWWMRRMMD